MTNSGAVYLFASTPDVKDAAGYLRHTTLFSLKGDRRSWEVVADVHATLLAPPHPTAGVFCRALCPLCLFLCGAAAIAATPEQSENSALAAFTQATESLRALDQIPVANAKERSA